MKIGLTLLFALILSETTFGQKNPGINRFAELTNGHVLTIGAVKGVSYDMKAGITILRLQDDLTRRTINIMLNDTLRYNPARPPQKRFKNKFLAVEGDLYTLKGEPYIIIRDTTQIKVATDKKY